MELLNEDIRFITEETLESGLFVPLDGQEDDDSAIYTVEPGERCAAQAIDMNVLLGESVGKGREQPSQWSPLSPEKLEEVMKEANMLAGQLERCRLLDMENGRHETRLPVVPELSLLPPTGVLHSKRPSSRTPRRKTFNVHNSPLKALLPTVSPETTLAFVSSKAIFSKGRNPASRVVGSPSPKRPQSKSQICIIDNQLAKKAASSQSFKASTSMKSGIKKPQTTNKNTNKTSSPRVSIPTCAHESLHPLKPFLQTSSRRPLEKTKGASSNHVSVEEHTQLSLKDPSNENGIPATYVDGRPRSRLCASQTSHMKKCLAVTKVASLQKAKPSHLYESKLKGGDSLQAQAFYKHHSSSSQIQTRCTAPSALASQLPKLKTTGHTVNSGRPSQLKSWSVRVPGGQASAVPSPAGMKASTFEQTTLSVTPQKSRLRLPKKTISTFEQTTLSVTPQKSRLRLPKKTISASSK